MARSAGSLSLAVASPLCSSRNALIRSGIGTRCTGEPQHERLGLIILLLSIMATRAAKHIRSNIGIRRGLLWNGTAPSVSWMSNSAPAMRGGFKGSGWPNRSMFAYSCARNSPASSVRPSVSLDTATFSTSFITCVSLSGLKLSHFALTFGF